MHDLLLVLRRNVGRGTGILEPLKNDELSAEDGTVKIERFFGVPVEVQICVEYRHTRSLRMIGDSLLFSEREEFL
jgi:hypothetical protein